MGVVERSLKDALLAASHELPRRRNIAYEIHYRMPRKLGKAYQASHFSLIRRSPEDWNFEASSAAVLRRFNRTEPAVHTAIFADPPANREIWDQIAASYDTILADETALFVFGAFDRVIDLVARNAVDEQGISSELKQGLAAWADRFRAFIRNMSPLEVEIRDDASIDDLGSSRRWLEKKHRADADEWPGLESLFHDFRHIKLKTEPSPELRQTAEILQRIDYYLRWGRSPQSWNYTFIESLNSEGEAPAHYLSTVKHLLAACAMEPSILSARGLPEVPVGRDFPGFLLAGAHYFLLPIDMLLALSVMAPATLGFSSPGAVVQTLANLRRSGEAGLELGKATRFLQAMEEGLRRRRAEVAHLLAICLELHGKEQTLVLFERHWGGLLPSAEEARVRSRIAGELDALFVQSPKTWSGHIARFFQDTGTQDPIAVHGVYRFMGNLVREALLDPAMTEAAKERILRHVALVTQSFWEFAVAPNLSSRQRRHGQIEGAAANAANALASDFVCSSMIERRCLYFSNFMPENDDLFTRTLFIDIGMEGLQSARVLQRLSDILTYRSMPLRHLDRVNAAIEALLELNLRLNRIQEKATSANITALHNQLTEALDISRSVARLNGFITYGISGQWRSADAYLKQILERCEDVRETRIEGFAILTDFVRRRLAHSVRFVERMHGHQSTVVRRVSELMDRTRTELDNLRTKEIEEALRAQTDTVRQLKATSDTLVVAVGNLTAISDKMRANLETLTEVSGETKQNLSVQNEILRRVEDLTQNTTRLLDTQNRIMQGHTGLLKSAEALILIGSAYYLFSLMSKFVHASTIVDFFRSVTLHELPNLAVTFVAMLATFVLSVLFMKLLWPKTDQVVDRWLRPIYRRFGL